MLLSLETREISVKPPLVIVLRIWTQEALDCKRLGEPGQAQKLLPGIDQPQRYFLSSVGQFTTTVIGSGLVWPAGVIIRNLCPSSEGT